MIRKLILLLSCEQIVSFTTLFDFRFVISCLEAYSAVDLFEKYDVSIKGRLSLPVCTVLLLLNLFGYRTVFVIDIILLFYG